MEKDNEIIEIKPKNMFAAISITQIICVVVILLAVLVIKLGFKPSFIKLQDWCKNNILEPTHITAVFDGEQQ
ncbi:MAG: hypothetical protein Q4B40_00065 [Clostridia bacterium]|nr:hypothetical protein [Clostridia bacterium]